MNNINNYYSKKDINTFLNILESIIRNKDEGQALVNGKILSVKIDVKKG